MEDNGRGSPASRQTDAFQPFNRLGAENGSVEGSGVGLALVKNLVEMMGGRIGFESEEGVGSKFWVDMIVAENSGVAAHAGPKTKSVSGALSSSCHGKILYVEDNENNRLLFRNIISTFKNVEIIEAETGALGLEMAIRERPDIVFLNINLPGLNGYDVLKAMRENDELRSMPIVALTANAMAGDADRGLEMGFYKYLTKPIRIDQILETVLECLSKPSQPLSQ